MWTLLLSRQTDQPGSFLDRRQLDAGAIRIGRDAAKADWAIPDPTGQISRLHCTVSAVGLELFVTDTSTNGVSLNQPQQRVTPNMPVPIRVRDRLLLGDFAIEVATDAAGLAASIQPQAAAWPAPQQQPGFAQPDPWFGGGAQDSIWGPGAPPQGDVHEFLGDALHDFLAPPKASAAFAVSDPWGGPLADAFSKPILSAPVAAASADFSIPEDWAMPAGGGASGATDPFDGMGDPFGTPPAPAPALPSTPRPMQPQADPFANFAPASSAPDPFAKVAPAPPPSFDPVALPDRPQSPPADPFASGAPQAPSSDPFAGLGAPSGLVAPDDDPFALPPPKATADSPSATPVRADPFLEAFGSASSSGDDLFAARAPSSPPDPLSGSQKPPVAVSTPSTAAARVSDGAEAWTAFCEGAGLDPTELRAAPDAMRRLGVLYRQVVLGLSDLIQDRAAFKNEFRVEQTMIGIGRNNPLKHLPALDSAKLLLGDPLPGFMPADESVRTAFEDVKKHQLAMLAGVQHALRVVFERLSPSEIERIMAKAEGQKRGVFKRPDPWSVYKAVFEALQKDAASNVNSVMSVAFREGYERFLSTQG